MCVPAHLSVRHLQTSACEAGEGGGTGTGVTGSSEPRVAAGNRTQVLWKCSQGSKPLSYVLALILS